MPSIPNVRDSSGTIGTTRSPIAGSRTSVLRMRTNAIVVEFSRSPLPSSTVVNGGGVGSGSASAWRAGRLPPSACAALEQVAELGAVLGRPVEEGARRLLVGELEAEPVADREPRLLVHRLLLVGDVPALAGLPHPVALDRLREDHGRLAGRPARRPRRRRRPSAGRGRRGGAPRSARRSSPRPSRASRGTCRRSARGRRRRPST